MRQLLLALLVLTTGCSAQAGEDGPLLVAAASDLGPAFTELGEAYERDTGRAVTFTFGSSGQLSQQIANGAPFEVFASANEAYVDDVLEAGQGDRQSKAQYALGQLVVWTRPDAAQAGLSQLGQARFRRIAVANPEHAPYGAAAVQALRSAGLYDQVRDRLVYGENVSDTLRLASSGNADVAIVAQSLAAVEQGGHYTEVQPGLHEPLRQALVVTAEPERAEAAQDFADLVVGARGREVLSRFGFAPPEV